jgi:hypothetical protein
MGTITRYHALKYALLLLCGTAFNAAWAQSKRLDPESDTAFWYALKAQDAAKIGLTDLTTSTDSLHFRYWMENQAIDVWTNDFVHFGGIISNHTEQAEFDPSTHQPPKNPKYYCDRTGLSASRAREVYNLFETAQVFQILIDKQVKGCKNGDDGEEYLLATSWSTFLKILPIGWYREGEVGRVYTGKLLKKKS